MIINNKDLYIIKGGTSASALNAVARLINTILDLGRAIGSSIYRFKNKTRC